jgi:hypothetical protein
MACEMNGCGVSLHQTHEHYDGWDAPALRREIYALIKKQERLIEHLFLLSCACPTNIVESVSEAMAGIQNLERIASEYREAQGAQTGQDVPTHHSVKR